MRRGRRKGPVYWNPPTPPLSKSARKVVASAIILVAIFVIAGIGYTFYMDGTSDTTLASTVPDTKPASQPFKPVKPAANASVGVAVEAFSSLAQIGSEASIAVRTTAGATCKIAVLYNKIPSTAAGLEPKVADDYGTAQWNWTIGPATPTGMWPVDITCSRNHHSGFVEATLDVSK